MIPHSGKVVARTATLSLRPLCGDRRESAEALAAAIDREAGLTHNIAQLRAQLEEWEEREADWRG